MPLALDATAGTSRAILLESGPLDGVSYPQYDAIHTGQFVYVEYVTTGERELYDLQVDPFQVQSLHASPLYSVELAALQARLAVLRTCVGVTCN